MKILVTKDIEIYFHHTIREMRKILVLSTLREIYFTHIIWEMRKCLVTNHIEKDLFSPNKIGNEDFVYQAH